MGERLITYVHFPQGETVRSIGAGDTESFQITRLQEGRVIAFKPEILNSDSNLTVLTNRGTYNFYLVPAESAAERKRVPFRVTFYNKNNSGGTTTRRGTVARSEPKPTGRFVNQNYSRSGKAEFAPTAVWDDGVHTYMQIPQDAELPGIFRVLPDGRELMVNTTVKEARHYPGAGPFRSLDTAHRGHFDLCSKRWRRVSAGKCERSARHFTDS